MRLNIKYLLLFSILCCSILPIQAQTTAMDSLEKQINRLESEQQHYLSQRVELNSQVTELADQIAKLKEKPELNYLQRRRLEGYLQSSQELANRIEIIDLSISRTEQQLKKDAKALIRLYNQNIARTLNTLLQNNKLKNNEKTKLYYQVIALKQKRDILTNKLGSATSDLANPFQVRIDDDDTPRRIKQKADWIKDQEDKLRKEAQVIARQIVTYEDEIEIREKMNHLEQEISLFNHQDEALSRISLAQQTDNKEQTLTEDEYRNWDGDPENAIGSGGTNDSQTQLVRNLRLQTGQQTLSEMDIETLIQSLKNQQQQLLNQADSLQKKASEFYQQARKLKQQD
jgi:hypothetical protein